VKKKSPPYAIIGAAVLGVIAIVAVVQWKKGQDAAHQKDLDDQKVAMQKAIDDANANKAPVVQQVPTNMRNVYFATQPVEAGAKLSSAFFEKKLTPNEILPDAYPADSTDIVGFYAVRNIEKGDPLTPRNIGKSLPFMSQRISPGMRALSLPIFNAEYNNTGGFVIDGDRVDLLYTVSTLTGESLKINTQTIMQNVSVLYVPGPKIESEQVNGITPAPPPGEPISITFEVTPEQAQALIFLSNTKNTTFSMILRSRRDKAEPKIKPFDIRDYDLLNLTKVQKMVKKSDVRVSDLAQQIQDAEKAQAAQGTTNETPHPTPPTP
jgi:Flp pilus assembly protein CpaB